MSALLLSSCFNGDLQSLEPLQAVHLLQTAHGKAVASSERLQLRRTDTELRLENSHLKTRLHDAAEMLLQQRSEFHMDFRQPLWLTLLVAAFMLVIFVTIYVFHLLAFFAERNKIRIANRKKPTWERKDQEPDFEQFRQEMRDSFAFGLRRITVLRLMLLLIVATGSGSYFASKGYFKPLEEKVVPFLYLGIVAILILQAVIREVWDRATSDFMPMIETMIKFSTAIKKLGDGGSNVLNSLTASMGRIAGVS
mmetsp:Transcript_110273/g.154749  ORF Transcript_110273/g.154749 Transcript_110273/m.154749 type:complete len:252 (+) Transcript_110273:52-807(+)